MASKPHFQAILFLLSLSCLSLESYSLNLEREADYHKWISWHVNNFRKKTSLEAESTTRAPPGGIGSKLVLDTKLRNAEMNKVTINVSQDGAGNFKTIREAIGSIPLHNTRRVIVFIKPGVYREKIAVPRTLPFVTFIGESSGSDQPTITGNDTASVTGIDGRPLKTFQSATVAIDANYFVAVNMKFENTAAHEDGFVGGQAVALRISGTKAAFYNCSFYGAQDTLYDHKGLHYFNNCFIQGSVDFIFGYGQSLYENCNLNSIGKKVTSVTAQKRTNATLESGFSFKDSKVTGTRSGGGGVYLGRAWGDYSRVVFSYSYLDTIVLPQGWSDWGDPTRHSRVYYGEYKCSGPGANFTGRVPWARVLTDEEAQPFLGTYYISGDAWLIRP
ncbi:probable pectinesterase 53 [Camellia sinensis]|uniref:Pectinesterase n=1 Tax=Camellia sinensis var. sinensis TaxID=542762 RepID=A0A4S4E8B6_CAMSN|nr:probable pectinesterase 53 [Camellia sinensis]THG12322.1 hypothetical protein TEA_001509 [Camellia sinensis var. sinensis]